MNKTYVHLAILVLSAGFFASSCGIISKIKTWPRPDDTASQDITAVNTEAPAEASQETEVSVPAFTEMTILRTPHTSVSFREASAWNDAGFEDYEKGDHAAAADDFRRAILAESTYLYPHFNLACVLALSAEEGSPELEECYRELEICLGLDPVRLGQEADWFLNKLQTDADLDSVRGTHRFRTIQGNGMISFSPEDLLIGEWKDWKTTLTFNTDGTYVYEIDDRDSVTRGRGEWNYDTEQDVFLIYNDEQGDPLMMSCYDSELGRNVTEPVDSLVWDLGSYEIRMYSHRSPFEALAVLTRDSSPLHHAVGNSDRAATAALLALGIFPDKEDDDWNTPLKLLAKNDDLSLLRLFLGREGVYVGNRFYLDDPAISPAAKEIITEKKNRDNEELLTEAETQSRFKRGWYSDVLRNGIRPAIGGESPTLGWSCSNTLHPLGHHQTFFAFLNSTYVSAMPGENYSIMILDGRTGEWIVNEQLTDSMVLEEESPYNAMTYENALLRRLMELEDRWIPLLRKYNIEPSPKSLSLNPLPYSLDGHTYNLEIYEKQPDDGGEFGFETFESTYLLHFLIDGQLSRFDGIREINGMEVSLLGFVPVQWNDTVIAFLVFLQIQSWGFEGETDSWVIAESFLLNDY